MKLYDLKMLLMQMQMKKEELGKLMVPKIAEESPEKRVRRSEERENKEKEVGIGKWITKERRRSKMKREIKESLRLRLSFSFSFSLYKFLLLFQNVFFLF